MFTWKAWMDMTPAQKLAAIAKLGLKTATSAALSRVPGAGQVASMTHNVASSQ